MTVTATLSRSTFTGLRCKECGHPYEASARHVCEDVCFGPLEVVYDYEAIKNKVSRATIEAGPASIWRYRDFLPIEGDPIDVGTGFTPLLKAGNLAKRLGLKSLYIKNDGVNMPTLSFKDRVVSVALTRARELGFTTVSCASTGNLANSTAAIAAHAGLDCCVFIPSDLELGKVLGTLVYNPTLMAVHGNYDQVNRLCSEVANTFGWGFVNINLRPYYSEGSKTLGYEVIEQLGWQLPDHIVAPLASGSLFTKIRKGFDEFITKPVHPKEFIFKIQSLLAKQEEKGFENLTEAESLPILNHEVYHQLLRLSTKEVIDQVYTDFMEECTSLSQVLDLNSMVLPSEEILRAIHTIKGNSGTLGVEKIYAAAKCSESLGRQGKSIDFAESLHYLKATLVEFQEFIKKEPNLYGE